MDDPMDGTKSRTYLKWQTDYSEHERRIQKRFKTYHDFDVQPNPLVQEPSFHQFPRIQSSQSSGSSDMPNITWSLSEIDEWANSYPKMRRWMQITWWTPMPEIPIKKTDNFTSTIAYCSIGDITYTMLFCLDLNMIRMMSKTDRYWRSFGGSCIRDIKKHGHQWKPPEDYF